MIEWHRNVHDSCLQPTIGCDSRSYLLLCHQSLEPLKNHRFKVMNLARGILSLSYPTCIVYRPSCQGLMAHSSKSLFQSHQRAAYGLKCGNAGVACAFCS
jgi:hypothetical protein